MDPDHAALEAMQSRFPEARRADLVRFLKARKGDQEKASAMFEVSR